MEPHVPESDETATRWGLLDTRDDCWLGRVADSGPTLYEREQTARLSAQFIDARMGWPPGRTVATPFLDERVFRRDELTFVRSGEQAVALLEEAHLL